MAMSVSRKDFKMVRGPDTDPGLIVIQAEVQLKIPSKQGGYWTLQTIKSPGLWGIEDDSDEDYFEEVYREECDRLTEMLEQMGLTVTD